MTRINSARVVGGGILVGLIMNVVDAFTNGFIAGSRWQAEGNVLNAALMQRPGLAASSTIGWITVDLLLGILLVWLYAAIRPRFGPSVRTALVAAFVVWLATHLYFASYAFAGLYSAGLIATSSIGSLVGMLVGGYFGWRVYREE